MTKFLLTSKIIPLAFGVLVLGMVLARVVVRPDRGFLVYRVYGEGALLYDPTNNLSTPILRSFDDLRRDTLLPFAYNTQGQLAFSGVREENRELYLLNPLDFTTPPVNITQSSSYEYPLAWSPDGQNLLAVRDDGILWRFPLNGGVPQNMGISAETFQFGPGQTQPNTPADRRVKSPAIHPDAKTLAFAVAEVQDREIWALENFLPTLNAGR